MKKNKKYIIILLLFLVLLIAVEMMTPDPVDWTPSFSKMDKIPYGNYILFKMLPEIFPNKNITVIYDSVYDSLKGRDIKDTNYIIINYAVDFDKYDTEEILKFASKGGHVFIAAHFFMGEFAEKFKIKTQFKLDKIKDITEDEMGINFANTYIKAVKNYIIKKKGAHFYFSSFDKKGTVLLGLNNDKYPNFIKIKHGRGAFYLSSIPFVFTNYTMLLGNNSDYISKALSYLPVRNTFWDEYYKAGRSAPSTPMRFILTKESLTWAYYIAMAALLIFILIKARRTQRISPVIEPLANASLEFIETVGKLYFERRDNKNIAEKKILYFFDYIRSKLYLDPSHFSDSLYKQLSGKTAVQEKEIKILFDYINMIQKREKISDSQLMRLNSLIEEFDRKIKGNKI